MMGWAAASMLFPVTVTSVPPLYNDTCHSYTDYQQVRYDYLQLPLTSSAVVHIQLARRLSTWVSDYIVFTFSECKHNTNLLSPVHTGDKVESIGDSRLCRRFVAGFGDRRFCRQCVLGFRRTWAGATAGRYWWRQGFVGRQRISSCWLEVCRRIEQQRVGLRQSFYSQESSPQPWTRNSCTQRLYIEDWNESSIQSLSSYCTIKLDSVSYTDLRAGSFPHPPQRG